MFGICVDSDNANDFKLNECSALDKFDEVDDVSELDEVDEVDEFAKGEVVDEFKFYTLDAEVEEEETAEAEVDILNRVDEVHNYEVGSEVYKIHKVYEVEVFTLGNLYILHTFFMKVTKSRTYFLKGIIFMTVQ